MPGIRPASTTASPTGWQSPPVNSGVATSTRPQPGGYDIYKVDGVWFNYAVSDAMVDAAGDLTVFEGELLYINHDKRVHNFL